MIAGKLVPRRRSEPGAERRAEAALAGVDLDPRLAMAHAVPEITAEHGARRGRPTSDHERRVPPADRLPVGVEGWPVERAGREVRARVAGDVRVDRNTGRDHGGT